MAGYQGWAGRGGASRGEDENLRGGVGRCVNRLIHNSTKVRKLSPPVVLEITQVTDSISGSVVPLAMF